MKLSQNVLLFLCDNLEVGIGVLYFLVVFHNFILNFFQLSFSCLQVCLNLVGISLCIFKFLDELGLSLHKL